MWKVPLAAGGVSLREQARRFIEKVHHLFSTFAAENKPLFKMESNGLDSVDQNLSVAADFQAGVDLFQQGFARMKLAFHNLQQELEREKAKFAELSQYNDEILKENEDLTEEAVRLRKQIATLRR